MAKKKIENVAIYLRKSRGDEDKDVLNKHRSALIEYANKKEWNYEIYEEGIASGDRLYTRPKMLKLLEDVDSNLYDGVLVMDYDRLSRGNKSEQGAIEDTFKRNNTYIVTPHKVYDLEDDSDDTEIEVNGFVARLEYKQIKKRFLNGKKIGAKQGKWTNGKPPFPYKYSKYTDGNNIISKVVVDEKHRQTYELMKQFYISGRYNFESIAHELNNLGMRTANDGLWSSVTVQRTILHEFHMGKVTYGKYKWIKDNEGHKKVVGIRDEEDWCVGYGEHEVLKTEDEHNAIMAILSRNNKVPTRSRIGAFALSGLLYCKKCGKRMKISPEKNKDSNGRNIYIGCYKKDKFGVKCTQTGLKLQDEFYDVLFDKVINSYIHNDKISQIEESNSIININKNLLAKAQEELRDEEKRLDKVMTAFENGIYSLEQFSYRKTPIEESIKKVKKRVIELEHEVNGFGNVSKDELLERIDNFKDNWSSSITPKQQNDLLKSVVKKIYYDRNDDEVTLEIEYL